MNYELLKGKVDFNAIAVDAGCSGNPGAMEYQGVYLGNEQRLFHFGPIQGTNNIGEFLAIVHALALIKKNGWDMKVYSDSISGMAWVRNKRARTDCPGARPRRSRRELALAEPQARRSAEVEHRRVGRDTRRLREKVTDPL